VGGYVKHSPVGGPGMSLSQVLALLCTHAACLQKAGVQVAVALVPILRDGLAASRTLLQHLLIACSRMDTVRMLPHDPDASRSNYNILYVPPAGFLVNQCGAKLPPRLMPLKTKPAVDIPRGSEVSSSLSLWRASHGVLCGPGWCFCHPSCWKRRSNGIHARP
jgi:hypothetical protein